MIWLEIPRGTAEEMMAWDNDRFGCSEDEDNDLQSYQDILAEDYPREKEWFFLTTSTYRESSFLKISDRCHQYTLMTPQVFFYSINICFCFCIISTY